VCSHCGIAPARSRGLCSACLRYEERHHGTERPVKLIERRWQLMQLRRLVIKARHEAPEAVIPMRERPPGFEARVSALLEEVEAS
jgi:hypothetical protein